MTKNEWKQVSADIEGYKIFAISFDKKNPNIIYTGTDSGAFKSTDGGVSWEELDNFYGKVCSIEVDPEVEQIIYFGTKIEGFFTSIKAGLNWDKKNIGLDSFNINVIAINPHDTFEIYAGTDSGLFKSKDAAENWERVNLFDNDICVSSIAFGNINLKNVYVGTYRGLIKSSDSGRSWEEINFGLKNLFINCIYICEEDPAHIYVGTDGGIFESNDSGKNWFRITPENESPRVASIDVDNKNNIICAATDKGILFSIDEGKTWLNKSFNLEEIIIYFISFHPKDKNIIYVGTEEGLYEACVKDLLKSELGIENKRNITSTFITKPLVTLNVFAGLRILCIEIDPKDSAIIFAGTNSGIFKSINSGKSWANISFNLRGKEIYSIAVNPKDSSNIYVGTDGAIYESQDSGATWHELAGEQIKNGSKKNISSKSFKNQRDECISSSDDIEKSVIDEIEEKFENENNEFNEDFKKALKAIEESNENVFITGSAGTGKSTLLRYFIENTSKNIVVVAPTGVAAINVNGQTIHSFFKFPARTFQKGEIKLLSKYSELFGKLDALVIDEISMVRADIVDAIDYSLKINRKKMEEPFGGVQIVMFGDLYQLPPVVRNNSEESRFLENNYEGYYFFNSNSFIDAKPKIIELKKVYRQIGDQTFISMLKSIRKGEITDKLLENLNSRVKVPSPNLNYITLATTNEIVHRINENKLASLQGKKYEFLAEVIGKFDDDSYPTDLNLCIKENAQIMLVKNDPNKRWVNGTIGKVVRVVNNDKIEVRLENNNLVDVETVKWDKYEYFYDEKKNRIQSRIVGSFTQFPIRLAWAITVHKSQGKTFENILFDVGDGAFAHGQVYVALSRCRSIKGVFLKKSLRREDIIVDNNIVEFESENMSKS